MNDTENTQLTPAEGYKPKEQMIFSEAIPGSIPDSKPKIEFKRINITTRNEDGTEGELVIPTERLYSFGVSENTSQETGKVTGYTFPLCMWNKDEVTRAERAWTETFNEIVECVMDHLIENREEIEMFELSRSDLNKSKGGLNPLYWKKEKIKDEKSGKTVLRRVAGRGPTLYAKLIYSKKNDKFLSQFFNLNDEPLEARDLMGKHCYTNAAVKIESIFIGAKISLQVKLYEAVVEPSKMGMKRLLARPKASSKVLAVKSERKTAGSAMDDDGDDDAGADDAGAGADDAGSLVGDDEVVGDAAGAEPAKKSAPAKPTGSRRTVKRVPKKSD
jgi:hypothetical protein